MAYKPVPMEDIGGDLNPFGDPAVQRAAAGVDTGAPAAPPAAAGGGGGAGAGLDAASATAALASFMAAVPSAINLVTGGSTGAAAPPPPSLAPVGGAPELSPLHSWENTLDEPVTTTLMRELRQVGTKMAYVLVPRRNRTLLRDWDLWGPLVLCLLLAVMLSATAPPSQSAIVFTGIFVIVWCGAGVITLNSKLLGGHVSFFQSVCVLGYCICPLVMAALIGLFVPVVIVRAIVVVGAFLWSSYAALVFLSDSSLEGRQLLAVYPIVLFYFVVGWMVLISKSVLG